MFVLRKKVGAVVGLVAIAATTLALASPASADSGARTTDIVGVGSDTVQNIVDFLLDGAPGVAGGYNSGGNNHRVFNFFATGDANGRAVYDGSCGAVQTSGIGKFCDSTTNLTPNLEASTVVLRDGTNPVTRPNGSGAGLTAITSDAVSAGSGATPVTGFQSLAGGSINFVRASRPPKSTEEALCPTASATCGGLHTYRIATDNLGIATVTTGFDGPAGLSVADLVQIYECNDLTWSSIPGYTGSFGSNTIHPLIPQSGSGTRSFFESALGITDANLGSCVRSVEEHDPTGIYGDPTPNDAIEPFSVGKLALINSSYFKNPGYSGTGEAQGAYTPGYLHVLTGGADVGGATAGYSDTRPLFIVLRQVDVTTAVGAANPFGSDSPFGATYPAFQAGGSQTWAQTLFTSSTSFFAKALNSSLFTAAGVTQAWKDCGVNMTTNGNPNGC